MVSRTSRILFAASVALAASCDNESNKAAQAPEVGPPPAPTSTASPEPEARMPDIIVDPSHVSVGSDRIPVGDPGLADKVAVFLTGRPMLAGRTVDFVAMRNAKPSQVSAVVVALQRAKAGAAGVKTDSRDGVTSTLPLSFTKNLQDCTTVAWIAKDAAIDVWPAGGGTAKRLIRGLAGPDVTLGTEAVRKQGSACASSELVVGGDDAMTWGLVFDLAMNSLHAPGARTSAAVLVTGVVPGRKVVME
jgi:hypothetical protein